MPDPKVLLELAERCERAEGPDRETELEIVVSAPVWIPSWLHGRKGNLWIDRKGAYPILRWQSAGMTKSVGNPSVDDPPHYTASIDAAMVLVPIGADSGGERCKVEVWNDPRSMHPPHVRASAWVAGARRTYASSPALALTAASLRALAKENDA